jgi:hypothetical protein
MKKIAKNLMIAAMVLTLAVPALVSTPVLAISASDLGISYGSSTGLASTDPRTIVGNIIKVALTILATLAVVIIIIGGFKWMTAIGNEEQIEEAKKILMAGIIGLVIILAAWALAYFLVNSLTTATNPSALSV